MVHSMTGFSAMEDRTQNMRWTLEIRGVNAKGLDIRLRLPDKFTKIEPKLRALFTKRLARGSVNVTLRTENETSAAMLALDSEMLDLYLDLSAEVTKAAHARGIELAQQRVSDFLSLRGVLTNHDAAMEVDEDAFLASAGTALDAFVEMRQREGRALAGILTDQLDRIATLTAQAASRVKARQPHVAQTLRRNLARVMDGADGVDETRVAQELALLAVKADVTEELDRLDAHIGAARDLLAQSGSIGRKLDFLMQEFNREANTLCSKSSDTELTQVGLEMKATIDQMREQVQNVE